MSEVQGKLGPAVTQAIAPLIRPLIPPIPRWFGIAFVMLDLSVFAGNEIPKE